MKVETIQTTSLKVTELESLDPITVHLEDFEPGRGKITIECYGESWSSYWGGMSGGTVAEFFTRCSDDYLSGCLAPQLESQIPDWEGLGKKAQNAICEMRRCFSLGQSEARDLFDELNHIEDLADADRKHEQLSEAVGDEWYLEIPDMGNPKYQYLCRIIAAVQEALSTTLLSQEAA